jgi:hypothetical protein
MRSRLPLDDRLDRPFHVNGSLLHPFISAARARPSSAPILALSASVHVVFRMAERYSSMGGR